MVLRASLGGVICTLVLLLSAGMAGAADGVMLASDSVYEILPEEGVMRVETVFALANVTPDGVVDGVTVRSSYDRYQLPLPRGVVDVVATSAGKELKSSVVTSEGENGLVSVEFGRSVFFGESFEFVLSYDIAGDVPRSEFGFRINPAYAHVFVDGVGDDGAVSVTVRVPETFAVETFGAEMVRRQVDGFVVLEAFDIENPAGWFLEISASRDDELVFRDVIAGGRAVRLRYWPGDEVWADFMAEHIVSGVPVLERLIGRPWFDQDVLEIRESLVPSLNGFGGWYEASLDLIELGEVLDEEVLFHELSHLWFNEQIFGERWMSEGLAAQFSALVLKQEGASVPPLQLMESDEGFVLLNLWDNPPPQLAEELVEARERYSYNASWWVLDQITDEVGAEGLRRSVDMFFDHTIAYVGEVEPELVDHGNGWKRFLDVLELGGGSVTASDLFIQYVVVSSDAVLIDQRAVARETYGVLVERGGGWAVPFGVRNAMDAWDFDAATALMVEAGVALDLRDEINLVADELGLVAPNIMELSYEKALDDFTEAMVVGEAQLQALEARGGSVTRAVVEAKQLRGDVAQSAGVGRDRVVWVLLVLLLAVIVAVFLWRRASL